MRSAFRDQSSRRSPILMIDFRRCFCSTLPKWIALKHITSPHPNNEGCSTKVAIERMLSAFSVVKNSRNKSVCGRVGFVKASKKTISTASKSDRTLEVGVSTSNRHFETSSGSVLVESTRTSWPFSVSHVMKSYLGVSGSACRSSRCTKSRRLRH